jgi:hypothetical protein
MKATVEMTSARVTTGPESLAELQSRLKSANDDYIATLN